MTALTAGDRVIIRDSYPHEKVRGETGVLVETRRMLYGEDWWVVQIDGAPELTIVAPEHLEAENPCPDCGRDWPETTVSCYACGLTVEEVAERLAAR